MAVEEEPTRGGFWQGILDALVCRSKGGALCGKSSGCSCNGCERNLDGPLVWFRPPWGHTSDSPDGGEDPASDEEGLEWQPPAFVEGGARYTGQWRHSLRHGEGILERPDGGRYEGHFRKGKANGHGRFVAANGSVYEGQWEVDRAHGEGTYTKADGAIYKGQWYQDQRSGTGSERWTDGSCYNGTYLRGKKNGQGTYWSPDGISYEGQFRNDRMDGDGSYAFSDRRTYAGQWRDGQMSGRGRMEWPSGASYEGDYTNGVKSGEGTFTWSDGRKYSGQWRNGEQHGKGVAVDTKGHVTRGIWEHGQLVEATSVEEPRKDGFTEKDGGGGGGRASRVPPGDRGYDSDAPHEEESVDSARDSSIASASCAQCPSGGAERLLPRRFQVAAWGGGA